METCLEGVKQFPMLTFVLWVRNVNFTRGQNRTIRWMFLYFPMQTSKDILTDSGYIGTRIIMQKDDISGAFIFDHDSLLFNGICITFKIFKNHGHNYI